MRTEAVVTGEHTAIVSAEPQQYSRKMVLAVWAAAALPMGALAWIVVPAVSGPDPAPQRLALTLLFALTAGLLWQSLLVFGLALRERARTRTSLLDLLWLRPPVSKARRGGRLWWWILPYVAGLAVLDMLPFNLHGPADRDFGQFLSSVAGQQTFHHAWALYALVAVELALNTFLGEELLFRGLLLPRMRQAFGRADWLVNAMLFGLYHLHEPWVIPNAAVTGALCAYPTRRYRSAWMGIAIHSVEAAFFLVVLFRVVVS
jgi:membrane protease YdiL (CAAX protease family)